MRYVTLQNIDRQRTFDMLLDMVEQEGFLVVYSDRYHLEIEAMSEATWRRRKHLSLRIKDMPNGRLDVSIELRNLGLEIKRSKSNLVKEASFERELLKRVRQEAKNSSAA